MVAPPGGGAFKNLATGITMGAAPMEESSVKFLNGSAVTILKMHIPRADYSMGIRTIAAARARVRACCASSIIRPSAKNLQRMCRAVLLTVVWLAYAAASAPAQQYRGDEVLCDAELRSKCPASELRSFVGCTICAMSLAPRCAAVDMTRLCRETVSAPDPQDPPFDLTRALFSGAFSSHMVLQREPQRSAAFGTAKPGAEVTVTLSGPDGFSHEVTTVAVDHASDPAMHGTWKVLLPARPPGFGYSMSAACGSCENATAAVLTDIGFGDVVICSGMKMSALTPVSRWECRNVS